MSAGSIAVTRQEWRKVLDKLQQELTDVVSYDETVSDEASFRDKFLALPQDGHGRDPDKNYGAFVRLHEPMLFFIRELDQALSLGSPETLSDVFWTVAFMALESLFKKEYEYDEIEEDLYRHLNKDIRMEQTQLSQFPRNSKVQRCLQQIFETYIRCYITVVSQAQGSEDEIDFDPVEAAMAEATTVFVTKQKEWEDCCKEAKKDFIPPGDENNDDRWEHIRPLGRGTYGTVDAVCESGTGGVYARKSIKRRHQGITQQKIEQRVKNEVEIMQKLGHKHIARVNLLLCNDTHWSIIMLPVADCDLGTFLSEWCIAADYPHEELRKIDHWFGCLISALSYAHAESIRHEDIKPTNVLIKGPLVYLTDFGTAKDFSEYGYSTAEGHNEQGTPIYWPPDTRPWGRASDVWALGCVFAEMLTVRQKCSLEEFRDFRHNPSKEYGFAYRSNIAKVKRWLREKIGIKKQDYVSMTLLEQIFNMLIEGPDDRPPAVRVRGKLREFDEKLFCQACA